MTAVVHRASLTGRPACGAQAGRISASGVVVTCPACVETSKPQTREQAMDQIRAAAARYREGR